MPDAPHQPEAEPADFVVAAYLEEAVWVVVPLHPQVGARLDDLVAALRALPAPEGALAMAAYDDDFLAVVRVRGADVRAVVSDATAAEEWAVAADVVDLAGAGDGELEPEPLGHLDLLADLGIPALTVETLCADPDLYPDEVLDDLAARLGLGEEYERAVQASR